jgi:hypothetical protein
LNFLPDARYRELVKNLTEVRKMLTSLLQKVEADRLLAKC